MVFLKRAALVAMVGLTLPAAAAAQQRAPAAAAPAAQQQQVQQWIAEMQQLNQRLEGIQARAAQDEKLRAQFTTLNQEVQAAMLKADPALPTKVQRLQALEAQAQAAQQAGDRERLQRIIQEAQGLQRQMQAAQSQALQQPGMAAKMEAFQQRLEAKMTEIDPQSPALVKRFRDLQLRVAGAMPSGAARPR